MHATIEQLLAIRDRAIRDRDGREEPDLEAIHRHVEECAVCRNELARLRNVRERLRALLEIEPSRQIWPSILEATRRRQVSRTNTIRWGVAASVLAVAMLVGGLIGRDVTQEVTIATVQQGEGQQDEIQQDNGLVMTPTELEATIARSQRLETLLQRLPRRPVVVRAGTDGTIASLKNSIAMVDYTLSQPAADLSSDQSLQLWEQRVGLMDSLVKIRYAEASQASL